MDMTVDPALAAGVLGVLTGAAGAAARWVVEMSRVYSRFVACYLLFILAGGGSMGIAGGALARLSGYPCWADVISGALGASAVIGFNAAIQKLLRKP
jgi:hypothetical protein